MDITCPHCHQTLEGDSSLVGETVTCPGCHRDFSVPKLVAIASGTVSQPSVRPAKQASRGKRLARWIVGSIAAIVLLLGCILLHNVLRESIGQHPEDGDSPEVLEAERLLLMDFYYRHGQPTTDDFLLHGWTENESDYARHLYVPWSCFMGPEKRIESRIKQLSQRFKEEEEWYLIRKRHRTR